MSGLHFGQPWLLLLLAFVPPAFGVWIAGVRRSRAGAALLSRLAPHRPSYLSGALVALATALVLLAAARPQWGTEPREVPLRGADLVVVLDVSRSMDAQDVSPSRIAAARAAIAETFARVGGDRVGLVIFAGDATIRFPLTTDVDAAIRVLGTVETGQVFVEGGSAASAALDVAVTAFDPSRDAGRLVLLISDGDDLGEDPAASAARLSDAGVALLIAGVGSAQGATIPVAGRDGTIAPKLDATGAPIVTRLNEPFLRALAASGGGRYLGGNPATIPGTVVSRLDALKQARFDERRVEAPVERFPIFIAAALIALTLAVVAENVRLPVPRRSHAAIVAGALLLLVLTASCADSAYLANREGVSALDRGDTDAAIKRFTEAQAARPGDLQISLNLAGALHAAGQYDEATRVARRATRSPDISLRARAFASIGHHQFAAVDLEGALAAFREALLLRPGDDTYRHDYEVVLRLLNPPTAGDGDQPGAGDDKPPGDDGTPGAGDGGTTPGATPAPGTDSSPGDNQGGDTGGAGGTGGSSRPATQEEVEAELARIDEKIASLQWAPGEQPTLSQALEILDLLAERSRIAALREALGRSSDPNDY